VCLTTHGLLAISLAAMSEQGQSLPPRPRPHSIADGVATVEDHLERILRGVGPLGAYDQPIVEALGLALDEQIVSDCDLPRFPTADHDGFAVNSVDLAYVSSGHPVELPVVGNLEPGTGKPFAISAGSCVRVGAGTAIPRGADTVVANAAARVDVEGNLVVEKAVRPGSGVRVQGSDIAAGAVVMEPGTVLGPRHIGLLAALGKARVHARPSPRIVIVSVGPELREAGDSLENDSIYDSNSHMIAAAVRAIGAVAYRVGVVPSDPKTFRRAMADQLVRADLVVTTGGLGDRHYDVVREVFGVDESVNFAQVAMAPGTAHGFGHVLEERTPAVMLPGEPAAAAVGFEVFVLPAIRRMMGLTPYRRPQVHAVLAKDISSAAGVREFVRAHFEVTHRGAKVTPITSDQTHAVGGLVDANALIVIGEDETALHLGDPVRTLVLDRSF
jgi:molybdopterin molybdotransferase